MIHFLEAEVAAQSGGGSSSVSTYAAAASIIAAIIAALSARSAERRARSIDRAETARRYREPLLHAAFNLQSRLFNILQLDFMDRFYTNGSSRERQYVELNTVYLVAQYLCWAEIIREEAQYEALDSKDNAVLAEMESVRKVLADSFEFPQATLRVFRGDQRAIGELMQQVELPTGEAGHRSCLGYASFVTNWGGRQALASWLLPLLEDIPNIASGSPEYLRRAASLQNSLVDIVNILDPTGSRVPLSEREKASV